MTIQTKAQKWGGSVTAPIPAAIARRLKIAPGTPLEVQERGGMVLVKPLRQGRKRSLSEILKSCRKKFPNGNPHGEISFGRPAGREIW